MHARTFASVTSVAVLLLCIATITRPPVLTAAAAGPGEFVWHDLVTDNPEACRTFYGALFGWTFESAEGVDPGYIIIKQAGRMIGGIVRPKPQADGTAVVPQWLSYLLVDDVNRTTEAVRQAGGRVYRGPLTVQKTYAWPSSATPRGRRSGWQAAGRAIWRPVLPACITGCGWSTSPSTPRRR
jgi:predicted enzyme related to lactoylglutathione lyase